MTVTTAQLSGDALLGLAPVPQIRGLLGRSSAPQTVRLGRNAPKTRRQMVRLGSFVDKLQVSPRSAVDYYTAAAASVARMYLNDRYGDCVFAGKAHLLGVWSANDPDSAGGQTVLATDQEISDQYFQYTGGRDDGAVISDVLDYMQKSGFLAGGQRYKIAGYVSADWRSKELTQVGIDLFGGGCIGINLPQAWTSNAVWDVTNTSIVGGHDVTPAGYGTSILGTNADGVVILSWGRKYLITWKAWQSTNWLDELYFAVPEFLWTGLDKKSPQGVDVAKLKELLVVIGSGSVPPLPEPTPTPVPPAPPSPPSPPVPPVPPVPHTLTIPSLNVRILGASVGHTDPVTIPLAAAATPFSDVDWRQVARDTAKLITDGANGDYGACVEDALAVVHDLHIFSVATLRMGVPSSPVVPWWQIGLDAYALVRAAMNKDIPGVVAALMKLAADFGLSFSPEEFSTHLKSAGVTSY